MSEHTIVPLTPVTSGYYRELNGRGIVKIERTDGDGSAGTVDTYTITYTNSTTSTFQIRNGPTENGMIDAYAARLLEIEAQIRSVAASFNIRTWATGQSYGPGTIGSLTDKRDVVLVSGVWYVAAVEHVAGASFATDLAAGKWLTTDPVQLRGDLADNGTGKGAQMIGGNEIAFGSYAAMKAYTGVRTAFRINVPGIAGQFETVPGDTTTPEDGGVWFVRGDGVRVRRVYSGAVNVQWWGAKGDGVAYDRVACQSAVKFLVSLGGGAAYAPAGTYLFDSTSSDDTIPNGLLIPDTGSDFSYENGITIYGDGIDTVLKAAETGMCVVRNSRQFTTFRNLKIDGGPKTQVIGLGCIPESVTQTTDLVSNSFMSIDNVYIENCRRGLMFQPGPTVSGSDSGCFYHDIFKLHSNLNDEHVYMIKDVTGAFNRVTRTTFTKCVFLRGNTGINMLGGTEIDFVSCSFELIAQGTVPYATPVAFYYGDTNPGSVNFYGGYAEACTRGIVPATPEIASQISLFGFRQSTAPDANDAFVNKHYPKRLVISKPVANELVEFSFGNASYVGFIADPEQTNSKTLDLTINGSTKIRWSATGKETFYGSIGNIEKNAAGNTLSFTRDGLNTIEATGTSSVLSHVAAQHSWSTIADGQIVTMTKAEFIPRIDNVTSFGISGFRWSAIWAANGTIQTSDPRTKFDIKESVLGLDFINKLRPVSYKFLVGGNEVVGKREVKPAVMGKDHAGNEIEIEPPVYEAVTNPVRGKRNHFGLLTTDVKQALGDVDFGGYIKTDPTNPDSEEALRYDEFIAPLIKAVQELSAKVEELEKQITQQ